jgi:hypothetical protein
MVSIREREQYSEVGNGEALVQSSRAYLHQTISTCWSEVLSGNSISLEEKANVLLSAAHTNQSCLQAVVDVFSRRQQQSIPKISSLVTWLTPGYTAAWLCQ